MVRGKMVLPGAPEAIQHLHKHKIPFMFMTNGGGYPESVKAEAYTKLFGVPIDEEQVCLVHTPMQLLAEKHADDLVLVVGKNYEYISRIAASYGLKKVITPEQVHAAQPNLYPDRAPVDVSSEFSTQCMSVRWAGGSEADELAWRASGGAEPIKAVLLMCDPLEWGREMQVCLDALCSDGIIGSKYVVADGGKQQVLLYNGCADFQYVNEAPQPRLGSGSFSVALDATYARVAGREVEQVKYGKPHPAS
jgi:HAD superfamily hydrolase (TIGR01456 family)